MSTADHHKVGIHPRVNIGSARWVRFRSAPTRIALSKLPGFDINKHAAVLMQRMDSNMMGVRRATLAISAGKAELERAKRLMGASPTLRGYL